MGAFGLFGPLVFVFDTASAPFSPAVDNGSHLLPIQAPSQIWGLLLVGSGV